MAIGKSGVFEVTLIDGRKMLIDGSIVSIEYEIRNTDGTKEIKLSNRPDSFLVKDTPATPLNKLVFDAYIINILDKDCSGDKFDGVQKFDSQRASFLTGLKSIYGFIEFQLHSLPIKKGSPVYDSCTSCYCLLLLGNREQPEYNYFQGNLISGLNIKTLSTGLSETRCASLSYNEEHDLITDAGSVFSSHKVPNRSFNYCDYYKQVARICSQNDVDLE